MYPVVIRRCFFVYTIRGLNQLNSMIFWDTVIIVIQTEKIKQVVLFTLITLSDVTDFYASSVYKYRVIGLVDFNKYTCC